MSFKKRTPSRSCSHCGQTFFSIKSVRKYCSEKCRRNYQNEIRKQERKEERDRSTTTWGCPVCGTEFVSHFGTRKFCSDKCARKACRLRSSGVTIMPCEPCIPRPIPWEPEGEEITANALSDVWPTVLPCGFLSCSQQGGKAMKCAACSLSLIPEEEHAAPSLFDSSPAPSVPMETSGPRVSVTEAAKMLRVHPRTLSRLLRNGAVYGVHASRRWFIPVCVVRSMIPASVRRS